MKTIAKLIFILGILLSFPGLYTFSQVGISTDNSPPDSSAILDLKSTTMGFLPPRMTSAMRNAISSPAEGLIVYCTDCTPEGLYYFNGASWASASIPKHYIGELFGGGIVFFVDNTGEHGLIASLIDISESTTWSNISELIGPTAQSTWNGMGNSTAIMQQSGHVTSAAKLCDLYENANYGTGIYSDWYLPALDQLSLIYTTRYILNKNIESVPSASIIANGYYWSSTEYFEHHAWVFWYDYVTTYPDPKNDANIKNRVRAIRNF